MSTDKSRHKPAEWCIRATIYRNGKAVYLSDSGEWHGYGNGLQAALYAVETDISRLDHRDIPGAGHSSEYAFTEDEGISE